MFYLDIKMKMIKNFSSFSTHHSHNLKILGLISSDAGMFQCVGMNPAGSVQASAFLEVVPIGKNLFCETLFYGYFFW